MKHVGHFIAGELFPADNGSQIFNPSNGKPTAIAAIGTSAEVDRAVAAARAAFPAWSSQGLQNRATLMLDLRAALRSARDELVDIVVAELGKTLADAGAEVDRAIEVLGQLASIGSWYGGAFSPGVSRGVDAMEVRFPIGVVAAISPFNFPVLIPVVQSAMALACGNAVVLKQSERDPSATLRLAEIFSSAGLPRGVLNVVLGGKAIVDRLVEHPDVAGISFVGSTPVAKEIRIAGVARNKRVQAFGGARTTWSSCPMQIWILPRMRLFPPPMVRQGSVAWRFRWWSLSGRLPTRSSARSRIGSRNCARAIPLKPVPRSAR